MTTYLITGATRGIGLELVRQLAVRGGGTILATARDPSSCGELAELAAEVLPLEAGDEKSIQALGGRVMGRAIDVLVNNAGVSSEQKSVNDLTMAELQRVFAVNSFAPLLIARAVLPAMRKGTRKVIFNITSQLGSITNNTGGSSYPYRASKSALNQLTVSLSHELKGEGFTCVMAHPGWVRTDMGGGNAPLSPEQSVAGLLGVIDRLTQSQTGTFFNYDGSRLPW